MKYFSIRCFAICALLMAWLGLSPSIAGIFPKLPTDLDVTPSNQVETSSPNAPQVPSAPKALPKPVPANRVGLNNQDPVFLNGLALFSTTVQIKELLGEVTAHPEEDCCIYRDNVVVRLRENKAVNICVSGELGSWSVKQSGICFASIGDSEGTVRQKLGEPFAVYYREDKPSRIMLFTTLQADVAIMLRHGQVAGFILAEPGVLGGTLQYDGYFIEAE